MMSVQTGDTKMDEAYAKLKGYVDKFDNFNAFENYFFSIAKTDDNKKLNKWLLKVLFAELKQKNTLTLGEDFERLLTLVDGDKRQSLIKWLEDSLMKVGG